MVSVPLFLAFFLPPPPAVEWAGRPIVLKPHQILWLFLIERMQQGLRLHMEGFSSHLFKMSCTTQKQQRSFRGCCCGNLAPHLEFVLEEPEKKKKEGLESQWDAVRTPRRFWKQ